MFNRSSESRSRYPLIPEYDLLARVTKEIIDEIGQDAFLEAILKPLGTATVGDRIWSTATHVFIAGNHSKIKTAQEAEKYKHQQNKNFQTLVGERMGLGKILRHQKSVSMGPRTFSEAVEGILGAIWFHRGGINVPFPFDVVAKMLALMSPSELSGK